MLSGIDKMCCVSDWSQGEIDAYLGLGSYGSVIQLLYVQNDLPRNVPWRRADFLSNKFKNSLSSDDDSVFELAEKEGKSKALRLLEEKITEIIRLQF